MSAWTVAVKDPHGNRKRTHVTSIVVDRDPTQDEIKQTICQVARLLVDDLYVIQQSEERYQRAINELHGHMADCE